MIWLVGYVCCCCCCCFSGYFLKEQFLFCILLKCENIKRFVNSVLICCFSRPTCTCMFGVKIVAFFFFATALLFVYNLVISLAIIGVRAAKLFIPPQFRTPVRTHLHTANQRPRVLICIQPIHRG